MQFGAFLTFYCQFSPSSPSPAFMASKRIIGLLSFPIAHLLPSTGTGFVNALGFTHCDDACALPPLLTQEAEMWARELVTLA